VGTVLSQKFTGHGYELQVECKGGILGCVSADPAMKQGAGVTIVLRK
jgi:hypothetical protein